jgi:hypothetical protein
LRALVAAAAAVATLAVAAANASSGPSFAFGRGGGNIVPSNTRIAATGKVTVDGEPRGRLTQAKLRALLAVAVAQQFFALPRQIQCPRTLPDLATLYVTVRTASRTRTVSMHGSCSKRFERVYAALSAAVKGLD